MLFDIDDDYGTFCINLGDILHIRKYYQKEFVDNHYCITITYKTNYNAVQLKYKISEDCSSAFGKIKYHWNKVIKGDK